MIDVAAITIEDLWLVGGRGVRVLLIDTGVEATHPALAGLAIESWTAIESDGVHQIVAGDGQDQHGHATAIACVLTEQAPEISLISLRALGANAAGTSRCVLAAIEWGLRQQVDIISCSCTTPNPRMLPRCKALVDQAFCQNTWIVAACDNRGADLPVYPGWFPTVVSCDCAALPPLTLRRRPGRLVEFEAAGVGLMLAWKGGGYRPCSGSSFAAAHATALLARLRELAPSMNACELKAALYKLADGSSSGPTEVRASESKGESP